MSGGYATYLSNLVPRMAAHPGITSLLVGVPQGVNLPDCDTSGKAVQWFNMRRPTLPLMSQLDNQAKRVIEELSPDVLFIPTARYWSYNGVPVVNMVRNMMPLTPGNSMYCLERIRNWGRFWQMRKAIEKSKRIVAVSQFVKECLTRELGIARERVGVVYHGTELNASEPTQQPAGIPGDWTGHFAFTAGLIYPYRGLEDLVVAWSQMRGRRRIVPLVIAGKVGQGMSRYYTELLRSVEQRGLQEWIRFVGVLSRREMAWCYENCSAFVMTSRVEACPNIALEAMAQGCVCVAADNPPLPEFFADAALYYPPGNSASLSERIGSVLSWTPNERSKASGRALARASAFTWDECCAKTVQELQKAVV